MCDALYLLLAGHDVHYFRFTKLHPPVLFDARFCRMKLVLNGALAFGPDSSDRCRWPHSILIGQCHRKLISNATQYMSHSMSVRLDAITLLRLSTTDPSSASLTSCTMNATRLRTPNVGIDVSVRLRAAAKACVQLAPLLPSVKAGNGSSQFMRCIRRIDSRMVIDGTAFRACTYRIVRDCIIINAFVRFALIESRAFPPSTGAHVYLFICNKKHMTRNQFDQAKLVFAPCIAALHCFAHPNCLFTRFPRFNLTGHSIANSENRVDFPLSDS